MRREPLATAAAAMSATLALAACGNAGGGDVELGDEPVTIRVTWWGSDTRAQLTEQAIDAFEQEHPRITVEGEFKEWAGYWDALATATAAGDSPDVLQMDELYLASYGDRGSLLDLAEVAEFIDTSQIDDTTLETGQLDGTQYAMPIGVAVLAVVANADLFDEYGVELPDDTTWTWDDYAALADELTEASDGEINGSAVIGGTDPGTVRYWARQHGGDLYDESGNVAVDPEVLASQWQFNLDLMESGGVESAAQAVEGATAGVDGGSLGTSKVAMGWAYNTMITALRNASGDDLRLLQLPHVDGVEAAYYKPSMYWSVSSHSEHPAEAALFVDFMVNHEAAGDILKTERGIPANNAIREQVSGELSESDQIAVGYMESVTPGPPTPVAPNGGGGVEPMLQRYGQQVFFGELTPLEAAEAFVDELQSEIDAAQ